MPPATGNVEQPLTVCWLDQRKHLSTVLELDAGASADRNRIYHGTAWTAGGFREFLKGGAGLVAVNPHRAVTGFALYTLKGAVLDVAKLIAPTSGAEAALLVALRQTLKNTGKRHLNLPFVFDL